jgi:hypothetical protein
MVTSVFAQQKVVKICNDFNSYMLLGGSNALKQKTVHSPIAYMYFYTTWQTDISLHYLSKDK